MPLINLINKSLSDRNLYIISNLIFSMSTYFVMLIIPYYLNIELLAEFTSIYQIILLYLILFEFGLSISYIRYKKIYKISSYINSVTQLIIMILIIIFSLTYMGDMLNSIVSLNNTNINNLILYSSVMSLLAWTFLKSLLLSSNSFKTIFTLAFLIFFIRILLLIFLEFDNISINQLFLVFFIYPFFHILIILIIINILNLIKLIKFKIKYKKKNIFKIYYFRTKKFFNFSIFQFFNAIIYGYTIKLLIIHLLNNHLTNELAQIGYAMTFIGIVSIFVMSLRSFYISKFSFSQTSQINDFLQNIKQEKTKILILSFFFLIFISVIIYIIKPNYLDNSTILYTNIIILSYIIISYFSMFTLLSKTFNENKLELYINIIRAILVLIIIYYFQSNFLLTLCLIYFIIPFMEYIYSKILLRRIGKKGIVC